MPDPPISDDDLDRLTRAYLHRRRDRPAPPELASSATAFALSHRGRRPLLLVASSVALVVAGSLAAVVVLAVHNNEGRSRVVGIAQPPTQVTIVRTPGNLVLPSLDRTIADSQTAARLASDLTGLPEFPRYERCPANFGTTYVLTFLMSDGSSWTATLEAQGCELAQIENQPTRWAVHSPGLWADLAAALGISVTEVQPPVCLGPSLTPGCAPVASSSS